MPVTRSITRNHAARALPVPVANLNLKRRASNKRQLEEEAESDSASAAAATKRAKKTLSSSSKNSKAKSTRVVEAEGAVPRPLVKPSGEDLAPLPAKLTFSWEDAKDHLIKADGRFGDMFSCLPCKPFESVEGVHPFQTLCTSIIAQQISWMAARAIQHKFLRLYFPELPETPDDQYEKFPTAYQVATTDLATLRTPGLSGRKAEYVRDLATRFADGRLTNQKLLDASDEELYELLTAVYGIGKWTVDMFAIFSLRRPDILPVGDLGVQRGLLRWILSLHQPDYRIQVSPEKLSGSTGDPGKAEQKSKLKPKAAKSEKKSNGLSVPTEIDSDQEVEPGADELPSLNGPHAGTSASRRLERAPTQPNQEDASSVLPAISSASKPDVLGTPLRRGKNSTTALATPNVLGLPSRPPPLTPSVTQVLSRVPDVAPPPLPTGLTVSSLRSRLDGKKKIKGAILTPSEMEALTEPWKPYRSIGVYYMWRLAEEKAES